MHAHPTLRAWTREEPEGSYVAELHGAKLRVVWHPDSHPPHGAPGAERGFSYAIEREGAETIESGKLWEEIEVAMFEAERMAEATA